MEFLSSLHWGALLKIIGIDIMLGVDNAIVIALACAALPKEVRAKAIFWGTVGAVALRAILLAGAGFLMGVPYVKLVAGAYLLFLGYKLLTASDEGHDVPASDRMFTAIKTIIVADFMMSLDNVLAVAAAANDAGEHSTMYAIFGIALSIPVIVFGAKGLTTLMERVRAIVWLGAGLLGWVGAEMVMSDPFLANHDKFLGAHTHLLMQITGFLAVIVAALLAHRLGKKVSPAPEVASASAK